MIPIPFRSGALALLLTAGFGAAAHAQTAEATASASPSSTEMTHTDSKGRHIAPHDTFYMLDYVSARTDKGVEGFPPGSEVKLVSVNKEAHTLTVTDGRVQVDVTPDKLTNDLDIAALVKAKDQAGQARIAEYQRAELAASQKYEKEAAEYSAKDLEKREEAIRETNERAQERATASQQSQPVEASVNTNGYYNEGGYGYGSPYGYFFDLNGIGARNRQPNAASSPAANTNVPAALPNRPGAVSTNRGSLPSSNSGGGNSGGGGARPGNGGKP